MSMEMVVEKDFLVALLNEALLHGKNRLVLSSPFLDLDLVGFDVSSGAFDSICQQAAFDKAFSDVQTKIGDPMLVREIPTFADLREALQSSLFLAPSNLDEVMAELRKIEGRKLNTSRYPRQACFAIDTNVAYKRLFTRLLVAGEGCGVRAFDPTKVQLLMPEMVELEVAEKVRRKYASADLEALKRGFRSPRLLSGFNNCCFKEGRKALNAQAEIGALKKSYNVWDVGGGEWSEDKEQRDAQMLLALAKHAQQENLDLLFLSCDDKSSASASAAKVPSMIIRYPNEVPRTLAYDPWLIPELMLDLSITFGVLAVRGIGVGVFGDWAGKTADHYRAEKVKLVIEDSSPLLEPLQRDRRIIERLRKEVDLIELR